MTTTSANLTAQLDQQQLAGAAVSLLDDQTSQTKLIASLVLFIITLACGYLPIRVIVNQKYIQLLMFAGGGVLMATAFCHLIPEAHDNFKSYTSGPPSPHDHHHHHDHNHNEQHNQTASQASGATNSSDTQHHHQDEGPLTDFIAKVASLNVPYLEMTLCCGFFFMYLVELLMLRFINVHTHEHPCDTGGAGLLIIGAGPEPTTPAQTTNVMEGGGGGDATSCAGSSTVASTSVGNLSTAPMAPAGKSRTGASELYKFVRGLLIVSAFSMHSVFDGVAIGSQDSVEKVWTIFGAISCHKLIIAAVVGLELFAATLESHFWTLVHLGIFSAMSPIGILLIVLAQSSFKINSDHPAMILLQSFATGTLLYIIFIEILQPKEEVGQEEKRKLAKCFSLIGGFVLMLAVLSLIGHGH